MRRCLDEAMLQSYFDGELSTSLMESATSHLASCASCAAAARELEEENVLLADAFALEFSESVPTERLRSRIDSAVEALHVLPVVHQHSAVSSFFSSLSNLFTLSPQRTLGYAALMVVLAFALIFGLAKLKTSTPVDTQANGGTQVTPQNAPDLTPDVPKFDNPAVAEASPTMAPSVKPTNQPRVTRRNLSPSNLARVAPVRLLPGERSYLQTIAKLDTAIKEGENNMRPALQVEYQRNLAVVDRAIAATRNEAKKNPNDPDAADFMFAAYQSKVDLLNTIADARVYNRTH